MLCTLFSGAVHFFTFNMSRLHLTLLYRSFVLYPFFIKPKIIYVVPDANLIYYMQNWHCSYRTHKLMKTNTTVVPNNIFVSKSLYGTNL